MSTIGVHALLCIVKGSRIEVLAPTKAVGLRAVRMALKPVEENDM